MFAPRLRVEEVVVAVIVEVGKHGGVRLFAKPSEEAVVGNSRDGAALMENPAPLIHEEQVGSVLVRCEYVGDIDIGEAIAVHVGPLDSVTPPWFRSEKKRDEAVTLVKRNGPFARAVGGAHERTLAAKRRVDVFDITGFGY